MGGRPVTTAVPARAERLAPLSPAQLSLWFLDQLGGPSAEYVVPYAHRLRGPLDAAALERALGALTARHQALRTRFDLVDGEPRQLVRPPRPAHLARLDLTDRPADARQAAAGFALRPFALADEDPLRALLVRLGPWDHLLVCSLHHICCDGLSLAVLGEELAALYGAALAGRPPEQALPPLPLQYPDTVLARAARQDTPRRRTALARRHAALTGAPPLALPTDHARPAARTGRGARADLTIPAGLARAARAVAARHRVTLFMLLLTVFAMLLHRRGAGGDLSVGTPVAGRTDPGEEALIGLFANTVVLRLDLSGDPDLTEALSRVRGRALDAYQDADVPFEHLVDSLRPPRDLSRTPLFQVMFSFQDFAEDALALPGLRAAPWDIPGGTAKFDLELELGRDGDRLHGFLEYSTDLFTADTAHRMAEDYLRLLRRVAGEPIPTPTEEPAP